MEKIKLRTKAEFALVLKLFINDFLHANPIFGKLNLNEEQMEILCKEMIYPQFENKIE